MGQNNHAPLGLASTTSRALPQETGKGICFPPTMGQESNAKPSFRDPADVMVPDRAAWQAGIHSGKPSQRRATGKDIGIISFRTAKKRLESWDAGNVSFVEIGHE